MEYSIPISGMTVYYLDTAPSGEDDKEILLLLHGWGASKETFAPVMEALKSRYRLLAPDLPGFGKTGEPAAAWRISDYCQFVDAFMDALGIRTHPVSVCGHSHGGRILIKWLTLTSARVQRVILIDSAGLRARRGILWYCKVYSFKAAKKLLAVPGLGRLLKPLADRTMEKAGSEDYQQASDRMRKTMSLVLEEDLGYCLPMIQAPTLLFWGDEDTATPLSQGRIMERDIPNAGLVLLSPAGHYSFLDQFPLFIQTLIYFMEHA